MAPTPISGWLRKPLNIQGAFAEYPEDEPHWPDIANRFLQGNLDGLRTVNSATTSNVFEFKSSEPAGTYYIKRFLDRDPLDPWKNAVRASRARRAVRSDLTCRDLGFGAAAPHCLIERRRGLRLLDCAMISEAIDDAPRLRDWLTLPDLGLVTNRLRKQAFLRTLAVEVARWHEAGLHHGDLRAGNLLIRDADGTYQFYWLDNERTRLFRKLPVRNRIHNLSRLHLEPCGVDQTDRLRFWNTYCEHSHMTSTEQQVVLTEVLTKTYRRRKKRGWA